MQKKAHTYLTNAYKEELGIDELLSQLLCITEPSYGLLHHVTRERQYADEPKFWHYSAALNPNFYPHRSTPFSSQAAGFSVVSKKTALLKCLCEAIERYCNFAFLEKEVVFTGSYLEALHKNTSALDPEAVVAFSGQQLESPQFTPYRVTQTSTFRWVSGIDLLSSEPILIPAQLIYLSYPFLSDEPSFYPSISTGAAGGSSLTAAILRGIYEVVERDAFMIFYLNKLAASEIDLNALEKQNPEVQKLWNISKRYAIELRSFLLTTDLEIPVVMTIAVDRSGIGKAVSVGLKSDLDLLQATIGSMGEAFHSRTWLRVAHDAAPQKITKKLLLKSSSMKNRGLFWFDKKMIHHLDFWLKNTTKKTIRIEKQHLNDVQKIQHLLSIFQQKKYHVFFKDITLPPFQKLGYVVVKVIIPELQPLYLNENFPLLGGKRLAELAAGEFNPVPHPFL